MVLEKVPLNMFCGSKQQMSVPLSNFTAAVTKMFKKKTSVRNLQKMKCPKLTEYTFTSILEAMAYSFRFFKTKAFLRYKIYFKTKIFFQVFVVQKHFYIFLEAPKTSKTFFSNLPDIGKRKT